MEKLNWDEFFVLLSTFYSARGSCDRLRAACVLVKNKRIMGAGYNGSVSGLDSCDEVGHLLINNHCMRTLHAERNAIDNAVGDLNGATAYVTATPCLDCVKVLLQNGVQRIAYVGNYNNSIGKEYIAEICAAKGVKLEQIANSSAELKKILEKAIDRLKGPGGLFKDLPIA